MLGLALGLGLGQGWELSLELGVLLKLWRFMGPGLVPGLGGRGSGCASGLWRVPGTLDTNPSGTPASEG